MEEEETKEEEAQGVTTGYRIKYLWL